MRKLTIFSVMFLFLDFIVKLFVNNIVILYSRIEIIPNFFEITNVRNTGAAFSILEGNRMLFIVIGLLAIYLIYKFILKEGELSNYDILSYSMLIGGIFGNLLDRIIYGYVIDYFSFIIFNMNFPVFNLADVFIVISVFLIIIKLGRNHARSSSREKC